MKNTRAPQQKVVELPTEAVSETGIIDINLRDMKGNMHKLSDLKGKAVILDFTIYQSAVSPTHNYMLRDLYDKYAGQGLETRFLWMLMSTIGKQQPIICRGYVYVTPMGYIPA